MALTSPGVEVTIIDQSQYLPAPGGSVPLVVFATAQNKADPTGTGVAVGTTAANAGKLYQVTSQRDLVSLYGTPFFYTTTAGTPIQGYELNEYGLLAAYSLLGQTNRCYTLRADIDLASLVGSVGRPSGAPANGAWWLDTTNTDWGIFEFNQTTGQFTPKSPIVITDAANLNAGVPLDSIGNIGSYAINATLEADGVNAIGPNNYFFKRTNNTWTNLGSKNWVKNWPTVQGTVSNPTLTAGNHFDITTGTNQFVGTITVPASPNNTLAGLVNVINNINSQIVTAAVVSNKLVIYSTQPRTETTPNDEYIQISNATGTILADVGISEALYYQPQLAWGTASEMPLWMTGQTEPRPTGSVWVKVGSSGLGLNPIFSQYSALTASWSAKNTTLSTSDWSATTMLDPTGGSAIPAGTVYGQYNFDGEWAASPLAFYERAALGPTVCTGTETDVTFGSLTVSPATVYVSISTPNSDSLDTGYSFTIADGNTGTDFVTKWLSANIPYTTAYIDTNGSIVLEHSLGGEIILNDYIQTAGASQGTSADVLSQAGFVVGTTEYTKYGSPNVTTFTNKATTTSGSGTALTLTISWYYSQYIVSLGNNIGTGYAVGDSVTVSGANLGGSSTANDVVIKVTSINGSGGVTGYTAKGGTSPTMGVPNLSYQVQISNWVSLMFTANEGAPVAAPANGTNWFYSVVDEVDIMVQANGQWNGYKNVNYSSTGFPLPSGSNTTDPAGPIISASTPTTQSDGTALVYGDLWVDTSTAALENYPVISRWESVSGVDQWVLINNTDQTSSKGIAFYDARWATNGDTNPVDDPIPTIVSLLSSDYLDLDAPNPALYPTGMLLFNTRRSGYNVKAYQSNYFTSTAFPDQSLPTISSTWLSESGLKSNGSPYMGRQAQRNMVVKALRSVIDTNVDIRDEDNFFNLIATPAYPELQPNMVVLNADRGETGYIVGDTPMRLPPSATAIQAWATNAAGATSTGEDGCVTRNTYLGLFYPSGITSDLSGNLVAVPPSHMMLRTMLRSDQVSYPWFAPAGTRRGNIDNATNIGYIDSATGEFVTTKTAIGIRDVLYINFINPLVFFTGIGLLNYGNKTSFNSSSALDRINVARLIAYVRRQLTLAARPFVFEPNDALTRNQIAGVVQTLMVDLKAKRGIYDYLVVCDESNNTPARIDRNELWVDVALEPVKAAEFIYIPVRVLNTGEIASL